MAKGNICEKCQKNKATKKLTQVGACEGHICDSCLQGLEKCHYCKVDPALIDLKKNKYSQFSSRKLCIDCADIVEINGGKKPPVKCEKCNNQLPIHKIVEYQDNDPEKDAIKVILVCNECKQGGGNKTKIKLTGCQCSDKDKEFEIDLKGETYDDNKDLFACCDCCQGKNKDRYKEFSKKQLGLVDLGSRGNVGFFIIKGAKDKEEPEPTNEKCADCQQEKKLDELLTIQDQGKEIKVCQECKTKRGSEPEIPEPNRKPEIPGKDKGDEPLKGDPNKSPHPENEKIWGKDFGQLKPEQRKGRVATNNSWKKTRENPQSKISSICPYCQKLFEFDKNENDFLPAQQKAEQALNDHKSSCPLKDNKAEQKRLAQEAWDKLREEFKKTSKGGRWYTHKEKGCWGKIYQDINIADEETARKQNWADLQQHKKECHKPKEERTIAVYHSPNQGGNKHANINDFTYENMDNEPLITGNEEYDYQQQNPSQEPTNNKDKGGISGGMIALIVVGVVAVVGGVIFLLIRNKRK